MADDFQGSRSIEIKSGDTNVPYEFRFSVATSSGRSDGALPWGSTLASAVCDAFSYKDGSVVSTGNLVHSNSDFSYRGNAVVIPMTYSTGLSKGKYKLEITYTAVILGNTSDVYSKTVEYDRIEVTS